MNVDLTLEEIDYFLELIDSDLQRSQGHYDGAALDSRRVLRSKLNLAKANYSDMITEQEQKQKDYF